MDSDILVIGAGPAGVIASLTAAKMGAKVLLCDAKVKSEIGNKTCGDAINLAPVTFLKEKLDIELPHGDEVADEVEKLYFKTEKVEFPLSGDGFILNRHVYGQRLLAEAEKYGVIVKDQAQAISALVDGNKVIGAKIKNKKTGEIEEIKAKITIDCSGRNFIIRKTLPPDQFPLLEHDMEKRDVAASYREIIYLKDSVPDHNYNKKLYLIYEPEIPEPGYFWIFPKGPRRLNIGIGWFMDVKVDKPMRKLFKEVLAKYYSPDQYIIEHAKGYTIPTRYPLTNAVANGFMTAGDAAIHVNPLTAEGHGPALVGGYYAGLVAAEAVADGDHSEEKLWRYNVLFMDHYGLSHSKAQIFTEALRSIRVDGLEFIFKRKILTEKEFITLNNGENLSLISILIKVIKVFPRYSLLFKMKAIAKNAKKLEKIFAKYPDSPNGYLEWNEEFLKIMADIRKM